MADTERLINKAQGDSIISAIQGITARLQEMYTVDDALSGTSENPVQNKVVKEALDNKVDAVSGKGLSTNDYTNEEKALVATIPNKADVDDVEGTKSVSGNPLTLTDCAPINAESLVVELLPKQDLHGQSAPYVGGAGKNKLPMTVDGIKAANTDGTWSGNVYSINNGTFTILTDDGGNATGIVVNGAFNATTDFSLNPNTNYLSSNDTMILNGCPAGGNFESAYSLVLYSTSSGGGYPMADIDTGNGAQNTEPFINGAVAIKIISGYTASNLVFYPMIRLSTETDPTFAPWSNICPITGYTECDVDDVGKNLFDISAVKTVEDYNGNSRYGVEIDFVGTITVKANGTTQTGYLSAYVLKVDGTKAQYNYIVSDSTFYTRTFIVSSGEKLVMVHELNDQEETAIWRMTNWLIQAELGSTATPYEPYQSSNATIQFGQTVYGGKSNFTEGGTDSTYGYDADLGAAGRPWWAEGDGVFRTELLSSKFKGRLYCSMYKGVQKDWPDDGEITVTNSQVYQLLRIKDTTCAGYTAPEFAAHISGCQLAYELATPTQLSTPPTDLKLLKGTNNITTNGTTINLGYQPDNVIGDVKGEIEAITEMDYLRILDNNVDTPINNYRIYYHLISGAYTLVNMAEMLQHRFIFVEVIKNPSGGVNKKVLHSALIDPRTIDGFEYEMKASGNDTIWIESIFDENKFSLSLRTTGGSYSDGDPTDYYVTIRMVD